MRKTLIGQMLVKKKLVSQEDLDSALKRQSQSPGKKIGSILVESQSLTEDELFVTLAEQQGLSFISIGQAAIQQHILETLSPEIIYRHRVIPVAWEKDDLCVAVTSPVDTRIMDEIRSLLHCKVRFFLVTEHDIDNAIKTNYGPERLSRDSDKGIEANFLPVTEYAATLTEGDVGVIRLVDLIMVNAYQNRVTDIHFESYDDEFRVRYRIDGVMYTLPLPPKIKQFQGSIISRLKIMSGLDIAERRIPQDGRMSVKVGGDSLNLRISTLPTPFGEGVQIRVFSTSIFQLADLGLSAEHLAIIENVLQKPHGIMFVCGPTGSGKTTTLYACLHKLNTSVRKIITIEDPVEYHLKGITQVQTQDAIGLTFDRALRSMLRHDPDVMLVGEVRDAETAKIAINIALTGHLVLSTLHSNNAAGTFTRLLDMGIEPHFVASSVECVIAQSLVRLLCPHCKVPVELSEEYMGQIYFENPNNNPVYGPQGCPQCQYTGYRGRTAIHEVIVMDDDIRQMVLKRAAAHEIARDVLQRGVKTLRQSGFDKVREGITSINEVLEASYG